MPLPAPHQGAVRYRNDDHACPLFTKLSDDEGGEAMLLEPGDTITDNALYTPLSRGTLPKTLRFVFASLADPDIIASLPRWLSALAVGVGDPTLYQVPTTEMAVPARRAAPPAV